jgi:alpha-tubulin suppressor-like RCC1 family protein
VLDNRRVKCWGRNPSGQLGQGDIDNRGDQPGEMGADLLPIALGTGRTAIAVTAGTNHTCALLDNHQVKCWGNNAAGQLGLGDPNSRGNAPGEMGDNLPPVDLGPGRTATAISAGSSYTCALLDNRRVKCWGANAAGQLGQGDIDNRGDAPSEMGADLLPIALGTGRTATAITAGANNTTCAVLDNGRAKCWGNNVAGQLGQGDIDNRGDAPSEMGDNLPPVDLGPGRTVTAINVGSNHACAHLDNRQIRCWGNNANGQLGLGNTNDRGDQPGEMGTNLPRVPVTLVSCDGRTVTVDRSLGEVPTAAADVILGLAGPETINGEGGNDRICGGNGNDTLTGSAGNDRLFGQNGNDTLNGQAGTDLLNGGVGNDRLNGGTQQDTCHGRSGTDTQSSCEVRTGIP